MPPLTLSKKMIRKKISVITLGCSKNTVDTEHLLSMLPEDAFDISDGCGQHLDCLLVNTCGFIGDAKEESVQTILEAVEKKKSKDIDRIVVFGCLSQRYSDELPGEIPEVDAWFGARDLKPVAEYLCRTFGVEARREPSPLRRFLSSSYAYLKISEGCDRRCSYCAIPHIRGPHRSVPMEDILKEARELVAAGARELILIAQDTTYYGLDIYHKRSLAELLRRLSEIERLEWIRIHYSYPDDFPEDVLDEMAENPKVCKYLDIPLQHISDTVLDNMRRHVDGKWTRELIARMRERVPGVSLRTTLIVGHPGEGDKEFDELMEFVGNARFERLGAFQYSEEDGTWGAAHLEDDVPSEVKSSRYEKLMELQAEISLEHNVSRVGTDEKVLVDAVGDGYFVCRSQYESPEVDGEIIVPVVEGVSVGDFIKVHITEADYYDLRGEYIGKF